MNNDLFIMRNPCNKAGIFLRGTHEWDLTQVLYTLIIVYSKTIRQSNCNLNYVGYHTIDEFLL